MNAGGGLFTKVTKVDVQFRNSDILAMASVVLDDQFTVKYIRVKELSDGRFKIEMPSRQNKLGRYLDVCHPITPAFDDYLKSQIAGHIQGLLNAIREGRK